MNTVLPRGESGQQSRIAVLKPIARHDIAADGRAVVVHCASCQQKTNGGAANVFEESNSPICWRMMLQISNCHFGSKDNFTLVVYSAPWIHLPACDIGGALLQRSTKS
jgi:hypothetical protein